MPKQNEEKQCQTESAWQDRRHEKSASYIKRPDNDERHQAADKEKVNNWVHFVRLLRVLPKTPRLTNECDGSIQKHNKKDDPA